ncbi:MAG: methyltransferase domain-containing protein [Cyanobacteria bacterium RI_101]|nr:methyltransferase domain-containing protein [Cyanobacteria bacterium RI_101]
MSTFLRPLSYRYPWLYAAISYLAALGVGGERRFHALPLAGLTLTAEQTWLDLCCGGGQATYYLAQTPAQIIGLDASPVALERARKRVPEAEFAQGLAENLPFGDGQFDGVHTSVALHEMTASQLEQILREIYRVLKPGGYLVLIDLHKPHNWLFWPPLALFMALFETETAWRLINTDLLAELASLGFSQCQKTLHSGGSLQTIQARR